MKQQFELYTQADRDVWRTLFERQITNLQGKACLEYINALDDMREVLHPNNIARFSEIDEWFTDSTGWRMECVPGLIPVDEFFQLLAQKRFCSSTWLRSMEQLDYLEEPDMFHDVFGHIPLLSNTVFSDFANEFGKLGLTVLHDEEKLKMLQRLYWFTIEFGLIRQNGIKLYGAGIASSFGESISSLSDHNIKLDFDLDKVIHEEFRTDVVQTKYFVINSFEKLFESIVQLTQKWKKHAMAK